LWNRFSLTAPVLKVLVAKSPVTALLIPCYAQMTVTMFCGWIAILWVDVAIQQHDECLFDRRISRAFMRCASDKRRIQHPPVREMLIPSIQSKWDAGPRTVLGPGFNQQPSAIDNYLRKANGRDDNIDA
jgi:hypothetical protein